MVHDDDDDGLVEEWSTGHWDGCEVEVELVWFLEASAARAWASQASRVLWSTGQASSAILYAIVGPKVCGSRCDSFNGELEIRFRVLYGLEWVGSEVDGFFDSEVGVKRERRNFAIAISSISAGDLPG